MSAATPLSVQAAVPSIEQKFLFARSHLPLVVHCLERMLVRDRTFNTGRISSIYYDTPCLRFYQEKRASEFLKTKVRLRWYGRPVSTNEAVECYVEVKSKEGGRRFKERVAVEAPASSLSDHTLRASFLDNIPRIARTMGVSIEGVIVPILLVQYDRSRYVEVSTGVRVAVDTNIGCTAVNNRFIRGISPAFLDVCVLEVKGRDRELPSWMDSIRHCVRRDAFSKYASCLERLLQPAGTRE